MTKLTIKKIKTKCLFYWIHIFYHIYQQIFYSKLIVLFLKTVSKMFKYCLKLCLLLLIKVFLWIFIENINTLGLEDLSMTKVFQVYFDIFKNILQVNIFLSDLKINKLIKFNIKIRFNQIKDSMI
jgi:hypothetical protein